MLAATKTFVATKPLSQQNVCRDKIKFVVRKYFCCDKTSIVLSRQPRVCLNMGAEK